MGEEQLMHPLEQVWQICSPVTFERKYPDWHVLQSVELSHVLQPTGQSIHILVDRKYPYVHTEQFCGAIHSPQFASHERQC
jgi:hypothetical protein